MTNNPEFVGVAESKHVDARVRSKKFALKVIHLSRSLPQEDVCRIIGRQLVRCATSVGANWRSAYRAKSDADMIHKLKIVEEECDEAMYWLELLEESGYSDEHLSGLADEAEEILKITVASIATIRSRA